ncbi:MAG: lipoate--protein ligase family protein, partial [Gemmatimonadota bacterium]
PVHPADPREGPPCRRWRVLRDPPGPAAWNMAVDEALARGLTPDEGTLRIYRWSKPSLSFGRNQSARERYDPAAVRALGAEVVRRPTGGREVLHDRELTYSVAMSLSALGGLRESYRRLNEALLNALHSLAVPASPATRPGRTPLPDAGACFGEAAEGEIELGGRKLVGSAQARIGGSLLQHGSILLAPPSLGLESFMAGGMGRGSDPEQRETPHGISLLEALHEPLPFDRVAAAVEAAMAGALGGRWERDGMTEVERGLAADLLPHYESPSWTWRT